MARKRWVRSDQRRKARRPSQPMVVRRHARRIAAILAPAIAASVAVSIAVYTPRDDPAVYPPWVAEYMRPPLHRHDAGGGTAVPDYVMTRAVAGSNLAIGTAFRQA